MGFYGAARGLAAFLNLIGFVMMLLATLSVPVVTKFDFMHATFENGEVMRAGIWGYCNYLNGEKNCVGPKLGYTLDSTQYPGRINNGTKNGQVDNEMIGRPVTVAFVFYPLVTSLCFFAMLGALSNWRPLSLLAVLQTAGAFGGALISWILSSIVFVQAHNRFVNQFPPGTSVLGPAFYFGLAALIALFISQVAMFAGHVPSKEEKLKKRMHGKPGKRAPFGNVNWSDESLPMEDRASSGPSMGAYNDRRSSSHHGSKRGGSQFGGSKGGSQFGNGYSKNGDGYSSRGRGVDDEYEESEHKI